MPLHIARAYGFTPAASTNGARPTQTVSSASPNVFTQHADASRPSAAAQKLVAGSVQQPVNFESGTKPNAAQTFQMYTRAADRVEAAVRIELGRAVDLRG